MSDNSNSGINFLGLLAIAFIVLKLCHVIAWSWWWVLAPLWGGVALVIAIVLGIISFPYVIMGVVILLYGAGELVNAPVSLFKKIKKYCKKRRLPW